MEDQQRYAKVYHHLLTRLTDLDITEDSPKPNEYKIAKQWGQNRVFIRRVLRSVMPELYDHKEREDRVPSLTLGRLVDILTSLEDYSQKEQTKNQEIPLPRRVTRQDKKSVLRKYIKLLPEERERLGLFVHPETNLLEQLIETVTDEIRGISDLTLFYQQALNLYASLKSSSTPLEAKDTETDDFLDLTNQIHEYIEIRIDEYYLEIDKKLKSEKIKELINKVLKEVNRIEFQAGIRQVRFIHDDCPDFVQENFKKDLISSLFLENLVDSIIKNSLLGDEFPVYIDYVEVERVEPLPLELYRGNSKTGLINPDLLDEHINEDIHYGESLEKLTAYQVKVHFYLYPPDGCKPKFSDKMGTFVKDEDDKKRLDFCEKVIGIGSPISHVITAINRFLLEDIPILKNQGYLPFTQKIFTEDRVVGNIRNSAVCSYTLVKLCKKDNLKQSREQEKNYDKLVIDQELGIGEYYGFDLLESAAKSALIARLRAIKQAGIYPQQYMKELCDRVQEKLILRKAQQYLDFYPFSLRAMQDYLKQNIFNQQYRVWENHNFREIERDQSWSLVAYECHLKILQTYLQEGLYRMAQRYIKIIEAHLEDEKLNDKLLISLYYLCLFRYHFSTDLKDPERLHESRGSAIRKAEECLNNAENILREYVKDYAVVGEYYQTNAHPFFYNLSRIYAHRAKLYIFFPYVAKPLSNREELLIEPIRLLEKARIYAARDGNAQHYAYWTVYQVWCYLIVAYLGNSYQISPKFSRETCIQWAKKLIKSALACYAEKGKKSYQQIKDNSGKQQTKYSRKDSTLQTTWFYEKYGKLFVQTIPLIIEIEEKRANLDPAYRNLLDQANSKTLLLELPMSVLTYTDENSDEKIYLFGVYSSIMLFGLGMIELCDDLEEEKLLPKIERANKRFTLSAAVASEGTIDIEEQGYTYLQRQFTEQDNRMPEDFKIRGLYPHRLTHLATLGKVFAAACRVILWLYHQSNDLRRWEEIEYLLDDLHDTRILERQSDHPYSMGQKRFNGHLEEQLSKVKDYLKDYHKNTYSFSSLTEIRNKINTDVFKILRGDKV